MPTESLAITYHDTQNMSTYEIPRFSDLSPGTHHTSAGRMWSWPGPDQSGGTAPPFAICMGNETIYNPHPAREFDLYYIEEGFTTELVAVTVPIDTRDPNGSDWTQKPDELPSPKQKYSREVSLNGGVLYTVIPLKTFAPHGQRSILGMFVSCRELRPVLRGHQGVELDMDEATGRVVI